MASRGWRPETSTSPASSITPGTPRSCPSSVQVFDDADSSARRIRGGAAAGPRRYDELPSYGIPRIVGLATIQQQASGVSMIQQQASGVSMIQQQLLLKPQLKLTLGNA